MTLKKNKDKRLLFLTIILAALLTNLIILNTNIRQDSYVNDQSNYKKHDPQDKQLKSQDLTIDNTFSGIGAAWNLTHKANRTDYDKIVSFWNNKYDNTAKIPIFPGWNGYELDVNIKDLYDDRNWNNGTFNFGDDDENSAVTDDDNEDTANNQYQNWTFNSYDNMFNFTNLMSGNYFDSGSLNPDTNGHDCLELRMNGEAVGGTYWYGYDNGDKAWWSTSIDIPRGHVIDGELQFEVRTFQILNINSWKLIFYLNNQEIYSIGVYDLERYCDDFPNDWGRINVPMDVWTNTSNIFTGIVNNSKVLLNVSLEYSVGTTMYGGFTHREYQQILIDNINLTTKAEIKPSQVNLVINQTNNVSDINWGKGFVKIDNGNWNGTLNPWVHANFSSIGVGEFGDYHIDLKADLNLFAIKNQPETNYEKNVGSVGTSFSTNNNSLVNWESYAFVNEPSGYVESEMIVNFPEDVTITFVSEAAQPSINISGLCDLTNQGVLKISVNTLSSNPDGFWKFKATSPNYCEQIITYNNITGSWQQNSTFLSGNYMNITAKITTSNAFVDISGYIADTKAQLTIRFPDGELWSAQNQFKSPDANGYVYFDDFSIPNAPPYYQAGVYQAIVTWNNSHSIYRTNETGIIYTNFTVIHDSILKPDDDKYYIEGIIDDHSITLKLSFVDKEDTTAISSALVYAKYPTGGTYYFFEPSIGSYWLEYDARNALAGNNTLMIFANSTFYLNKIINITIDVTKQTLFTVDNNFFTDIPYKQNFTLQFNYTEKNSGNGIDTNPSTDWIPSYYHFKQVSVGVYNLTCNTSAYSANENVIFYIFLDEDNYEAQTIQILVQITELASSLELLINDNQIFENDKISFEIYELINITIKYRDAFNNHLSGATVNLIGKGFLDETGTQYNITLNSTTDLDSGNNVLVIFANITDYNYQEICFVINVTEKKTELQIFLNSINSTFPFINLPFGATLNITAKYTDSNNAHIDDASIELGVDFKGNLTENPTLNQYSININTNQLGLGDNVLSITAQKSDYEQQSENLNIQVRKIRTKIDTEDGDDKFTIRPGESIKLKILIKNLDFGGRVEEADVTYDWEFGDGDLKEKDDGEYELVLENIPEGSYTIEISVYKEGGEYEFEDFKITLNVVRPEGETLLFQILLIIAIIVSVALALYLIAYQRILKYPKPVRKVRKYRRTLKKKKVPSVDITGREKAIKILFASELDKSSSLLKGKTSEEIASTDKMVKKSLKLSSDKIIEKSEKKSIVKKVDKSPKDVKK